MVTTVLGEVRTHILSTIQPEPDNDPFQILYRPFKWGYDMRLNTRFSAALGLAMFLITLLMPMTSNAAFLWGHPYAMQTNLANNGWVHVWNDLDPGGPYVGTARFTSINASQAHSNMWDMLVQGMVNKKLTFVWTNSGTSGTNDQTYGDITSAVVTIFGN